MRKPVIYSGLIVVILFAGICCDEQEAADVKESVQRGADKTGDVVDKAIDKTGQVVGNALEKAANTRVKVGVDVTTRPAATTAPSGTTRPL